MQRSINVLRKVVALHFFWLLAPLLWGQSVATTTIGNAPTCPYGYYDFQPYDCAPYGYYGPDWFAGVNFIGAGPWFHGPRWFYGHVNRNFDPRYGYSGSFADHGAFVEPSDHFKSFHATDLRDRRGRQIRINR
jgi:hypothetical protein